MSALSSIPFSLQTILLLTASNVFMPANRIGFQQAGFSVGQLKIMQEIITLAVFVPFALFYLDEPLKLDDRWAALCMVGAVYFIFRNG